MASSSITSSEFQKEYARYATLARREAVTITNHGRPELFVLDAEEYERLRRLDDRVATPVEALSKADQAAREVKNSGSHQEGRSPRS